jgi:flagellar hook-length control protein FliK
VSTVQLAAASRTGGTQDTTAAEAFALSASPSSDTEEAQNPTAPQSETGGTGQPETIKKESENSLMDMRQGLETHSESHHDALPPSTAADAATTQVADLMDELGGQLAYWSAQGSQRASLTLGEAGDSPLEVSLSLKDGTVDIAFESATPEVREALRLSAQDLLHTLLDAHGLSLGGVSVGGGQTSGEHAAHTPQNMVQAPAVREATGRTGQEPPTPAPVRRPPVLSAHKLDLFA